MCKPNEKHVEHWESLESCREAVADGISSSGTGEMKSVHLNLTRTGRHRKLTT